ncbi:MAG: DUF4278 domain-containing protein [Phormidesmis sp.]
MQLSYRGVKYNSTERAVKVTETQEIGHYRGATYAIRRVVGLPVRHPEDVLKYRGAIVR